MDGKNPAGRVYYINSKYYSFFSKKKKWRIGFFWAVALVDPNLGVRMILLGNN